MENGEIEIRLTHGTAIVHKDIDAKTIEALNNMVKLAIEQVKKESKPSYTRCSICHRPKINGVGSSCCGGFWEYLSHKEIKELGANPDDYRNEDFDQDFTDEMFEKDAYSCTFEGGKRACKYKSKDFFACVLLRKCKDAKTN